MDKDIIESNRRHLHSIACWIEDEIVYLQGDVRAERDWALLQGNAFNLVFSDASHHADMLLHELAMLERFRLLDGREFMMVWDDLDCREDGPLTQAFRAISRHMERRHGLSRDQAFLLELNGWLGQHEHRHTVGVINNANAHRTRRWPTR